MSLPVPDDRSLLHAPRPPILVGWRLDALALGAIFLLLVFLMRTALFSSTSVLGAPESDAATLFFPWRVFGYQSWREVGLPLWNPYTLLGMPFVGNLQSAMFYPTNLLCFLLPTPVACNCSVLINMFLSAAFTYVLARTLKLSRPGACLAALTYTLAANHVFRVYQGHWGILEELPWAPLLTLCAEMIVRKRSWLFVALGGCAVAMQILAGQPQVLLYGCLFACIYFIVRLFTPGERPAGARECAVRMGMFAAIFPVGVALGAAQLLPALQLAQLGYRGERMTFEWAASFSLPPQNLLTLVLPHMYGPVIRNGAEAWPYWGLWNFWETGCYMGLVSLMLFLSAFVGVSRRRWLAPALSGAFCFLLALGPAGLLFGLLYKCVPGFDMFRDPARALSLVGLSVGIMAGLGLDALATGDARSRRLVKLVVAVFAIILIAATVGALTAASGPPRLWTSLVNSSAAKEPHYGIEDLGNPPRKEFVALSWQVVRKDAWRSLLFVAIAAAVVLLPFKSHRARAGTGLALLLLAGADFYTFGSPFMVTFNSKDQIWNDQVITEFQRLGRQQPFRICSDTADWYKSICRPMIFHISSLEGIEPNAPSRFYDFFWMSQGANMAVQHANFKIWSPSPLFDLVNLKYVVTSDTGSPGGLRVTERSKAVSRAFIVHQFAVMPDPMKQFHWLLNWNHESEAVFEEQPSEPCAPPAGDEPIPVFKRYDIHGAEISVSLKSPAFLVLSDMWYPGWAARIDGKPAYIYRADYLLRAVAVPAGEHTVEFEYVCPAFKIGEAVSAIAAVIVIGYFCRAFLNRRRDARNRKPASQSTPKEIA